MRRSGKREMAQALPRARRPMWTAIAALLLMAQGLAALQAQEATPTSVPATNAPADPFYNRPATIPAVPGTLLRSEPLADRVLPDGAQAWRILYTTTAPDGSPALSAATIVAPLTLPDEPMPVVAWDHGAVGLVQRCLPSATPDPLRDMPAQEQVVAQGWIVVATDYQTDANGVHPFLIGQGEAQSTLDAVRALRQMGEFAVDNRTVVWGHSQGGHSALWVNMIAVTYAPDVVINGVVAISPPTSLISLLDRQRESSAAPILAAFLATAFSSYYSDVSFDTVVTQAARGLAGELATRCPGESLDGLAMVLMLGELGDEPLLALPPSEAFRTRLEENEPDGEFTAPVVVAQGLADVVVLPQVTAEFVAARCAAGSAISFWELPGQDHLSLVQVGSPLEAPLIAWTQQRFAGDAPAETCTEAVISG